MNIKNRIQLIRQTTPNCLEELFEMSNRICDLCGQPIQDLCLAALDHSIPVIRYARCTDVSIEDAIRECNDLSNLRPTHSSCNAAKFSMTRDEWFSKGLNLRKEPKFLSPEEISVLKFRVGAGGRAGGRKNVESGHIQALGRQNVENGQLASIRSIGGRISGRIAVETGQLASICSKGGRIGGPIGGRATNATTNGRKGNGGRIGARNQSLEDKAKGGRIGGKKTAENRLGMFRRSPEKWSEDSRKAAHVAGRKAFENSLGIFGQTSEQWCETRKKGGHAAGQNLKEKGLGIFGLTPEEISKNSAKGGRVSCCKRWRLGRGKSCVCGEHLPSDETLTSLPSLPTQEHYAPSRQFQDP